MSLEGLSFRVTLLPMFCLVFKHRLLGILAKPFASPALGRGAASSVIYFPARTASLSVWCAALSNLRFLWLAPFGFGFVSVMNIVVVLGRSL